MSTFKQTPDGREYIEKEIHNDFSTHNRPFIYGKLYQDYNYYDSLKVDKYSTFSNYSKATFSYDYNNNNFLAMLDADTLVIIGKDSTRIPVINSDSINVNQIQVNNGAIINKIIKNGTGDSLLFVIGSDTFVAIKK